ncbi:tripartite tricarboxylate transporter TctB family protein [uncultured Ruegeria sp.]|uniref:tripartite tricarboxylate transporter TctB family protein n=1 Tax=uncultured Ruegeria sp. TaxID=259304 RepID=UPI002624DF86|nr:tripartite tricarboxylate transporter TctB family protein [uncultured Ruegeria sp.]
MRIQEFGFDWVAWAMLLCVPLIIFWQISTSLVEQEVASGGPLQNAAIFPRIVAWLMVALSGINLFRILGGRVSKRSPIEGTPTTRIALVSTVVFVAYLIALKPVGYYAATPILLASLLRMFGLGWASSIVGALSMTIVVAGIFEGLLNVVLPLGALKFTLFG